jgi:hypothetical protein
MGERNTRKRPSVQPIIKRYLDEGFDMRDIVTEITPEGGTRVYIKDREQTHVSQIRPAVKPLTEWNTAPTFE